MGAEKPLNEPPKTAKELSQDILEGFLPAMAQIQAMPDKTDEQKKASGARLAAVAIGPAGSTCRDVTPSQNV